MSVADLLERARASAVERIGRRRTARSRRSRQARRRGTTLGCAVEALEARVVLSASALAPAEVTMTPILSATRLAIEAPASSGSGLAAPYAPSDIRSAYGVDQIALDGAAGTGAGETIAIVDAYNDPNLVSDVDVFDQQFGLTRFNLAGNPTLKVVNEAGQSSPLPANVSAATGSWDTEEALDVEWAHSMAPLANIELFEANSASAQDLFSAAASAADASGVTVVSMSFGASEFSGETAYDSTFTTPAGHAGVTFLASTGDSDAPAGYPAYSPNVIAVGGTSLAINSDDSYGSESAWGNVSQGIGGGGGVSAYEPQPSYQAGKVNNLGGSPAHRTAPDVSMLADINTGVYLYSSWDEGKNDGGYYQAGGTSLACPMWAGLVADADQLRATQSAGSLNGATQTLPAIYALPASDFHDVTTGNNGFAAGAGYDLATGLGTPRANLIVPQLAGAGTSPGQLVFSAGPSNTVAGADIGPSVSVKIENPSGAVITSDSSVITLSIGYDPGGASLIGTISAQAQNGVATFNNLSIDAAAAGYTLAATDGLYNGAISSSFAITPAAAARLAFTRQPAGAIANAPDAPGPAVAVEDAYGNVVTSNNSTIALQAGSGSFAAGSTTSLAASSGAATFSNLVFPSTGSESLTATDGSLASATSASFTVARAAPRVTVADAGGVYDGVAMAATAASALDAGSGQTIATLAGGGFTFSYYAGALTTSGQVASATALASAPTSAGAWTVVAHYAGSADYAPADSSPVDFTIAPRLLDLTVQGKPKAYDATSSASVTILDDRIAGDALVVSYGSANFASASVGASVPILVSGLALNGVAAGNYRLASTTAVASAAISPLAITGRITIAAKTYDGQTSATVSGRTLVGVLVGADAVTLAGGTATFNSPAASSAAPAAVTGLSLAGPQSGNYVLSDPSETATASILPRPVTAAVTVAGKFYDGSTSATIVGRSLSGTIAGDSVALAGGSAAFSSSAVGVNKPVAVSGLALTGASAGDYALSSASVGASATIAPLTISGTIFSDLNADGSRESAEPGLSGRTVTLQGPGGSTHSLRTDSSGNFSFSGLLPGVYVVKSPAPAGWRLTGAGNGSRTVTLAPGVPVGSVAIGETNQSAVGGRIVGAAVASPAIAVAGADSAAGPTVTLTNLASGATFVVATDASGDFEFAAIPAGRYRLTTSASAASSGAVATPLLVKLSPGRAQTTENLVFRLPKSGRRRRAA